MSKNSDVNFTFEGYVKFHREIEKQIQEVVSSSISFHETSKKLMEKRKNTPKAMGYFEGKYPNRNALQDEYSEIDITSRIYFDEDNAVGIYAFIISKDDRSEINEKEFSTSWLNHRQKNADMKIPAYYEERFNISKVASSNHQKFGYSKMLYIGKHESDLKSRLSQHISYSSKTTYSLHLDLFLQNNPNYKIYYTVLYSTAEKAKDLKVILPLLEKALHRQFNPLVGTSR
ncbi:hypothetical protein [Brevibacillus sp. Leaf182]|uniref:hypothetical protein n=1 Tax=Brevibacillus sp. Leaf182 TaxID=1736290 RepID=UPI000A4C28ED|nr:hypothetical protein [Brevibacillus sp. Leaf182]